MLSSIKLCNHPRFRGIQLALFAAVAVAATLAGCGRKATSPPKAAPTNADQVMSTMINAYGNARTYQDRAVVRLSYQRDGRRYEDEAPLSVTWEAPNRIRVAAYQVRVTCDGKNLYAKISDKATRDFDGQVVIRSVDGQLSQKQLYEQDEILNLAFRQGLAGYPLQLDLLLSNDPLSVFMDDQEVTRALIKSSELNGHLCYRVQADSRDGRFVLWIDQAKYLLRRIEYPAATFAPEVADDPSVKDLALIVDFRDATFDNVKLKGAFAFSVPDNAKQVRKFIAPPRQLPSNLFGKKVAPFAFTQLAGGVVSSGSLTNRIKVLVWFNNHPACQATLQQVNQVFQQYKSQERIAIYGVCVEPSKFTSAQVRELLQLWQVQLPVVRDLQAYGRDLFHIPWAPTMVVLDAENTVHIFEVGANPNLVAELPQVLERLIAGDNLAREILGQFKKEQEAYARALLRGEPEMRTVSKRGAQTTTETSPRALRLRPLWTNTQLKAPGNILVVPGPSQSVRLLVHDGWRTIVELNDQGSVTARHELSLPKLAATSQLRSATDRQGRRFYLAWSLRSQQVHLFSDGWKHLLSYPPTAMKKEGIQDAVLADLDNDGTLEILLGYWGRKGVECVSLDGKVRWTSNAVSHVYSLTPTPGKNQQQTLWIASSSGILLPLNANGLPGQPIIGTGQLIHQLFRMDTGSDTNAEIPFCGISYGPEGRRLALGLTAKMMTRWRYNLPAGSFSNQARFVTSAHLLDGPQSHWLIAGVDGSVHIISQDGRFTDYFQTGQALTGLAGARAADHGVLVISSAKGVRAWKVLPPVTAAKP